MKSRKGAVIALTVIIACIALSAFLIGGLIAGWDIIGWMQSDRAIVVYTILGVFALFSIIVMIGGKAYE